MKRLTSIGLACGALIAGGCGGDESSSGEATTTDPAAAIEAQNDAVIEQAQQAPDAAAEEGESAIRATLQRELGLKQNGDFSFEEPGATQASGHCYVKTGADAAAFSDQAKNILYSPNGTDLIFVQSFTSTPLADCLVAVQDALEW